MKKLFLIALSAGFVFSLGACSSKSTISKELIVHKETSKIYSDKEINEGMEVVKEFFEENIESSTLTSIGYAGDQITLQWDKNTKPGKIMIINASFDTGTFGVSPTVNKNTTYDWSWILVKDENGHWQHKNHGYL